MTTMIVDRVYHENEDQCPLRKITRSGPRISESTIECSINDQMHNHDRKKVQNIAWSMQVTTDTLNDPTLRLLNRRSLSV